MARDDEDFLEDEEEDEEEEDETEEPEAYEDIYETGAPERRDIATETFETGAPGPPAPLPRPPGVAPDIGRRSYMEALGRIQYPEFAPLPQYPVGKPGFKGALMDALRGMIPGYSQGMQAAYRTQVADVTMANKSRMDLFKEQMDVIRPMIVKDYETEAWLQKQQKYTEYLRTTYPQLTEQEILAYSMGKIPRAPVAPKPGTPMTAVFDDNSRLPVTYGAEGIIDQRTGKALAPELQARLKELQRPVTPSQTVQKPTRVRGLVIPAGLPGAGRPGIKVYNPDGTVTWEEEPIYEKPPAGPSPELQLIRELTIDRMKREAEDIPQGGLGPDMLRHATQRGDRFKASEPAKKMSEAVEGYNFFNTLTPINKLQQTAVIYALAKMWDPRTGVRDREFDVVQQSLESLWKRLGLTVEQLWDSRGYFRKDTFKNKILPAVAERLHSYEDRYHEMRNQEVKSLTKDTGKPGMGRFMDNYGENLSPFRTIKRNKATGELKEFFRRPSGELVPVEN
jgi:hypothetical protein